MNFFVKTAIIAATALAIIGIRPLSAEDKSLVSVRTVVIDAGHGGKQPGTLYGRILEKDITLSVALMLGKMIEEAYPSVKVLYTRKDDSFVSLYDRADLANKNNADLFISIHVNAAKDNSARGSETFVMSSDKTDSNFEVCQLENSVILLEEDYSSKYAGFDPNNPESYIIFSLLQNAHVEQSLSLASLIQENMGKGPITRNRGVKEGPFLVLWQCTMPAVLVELGFLSNSSDRAVLTDRQSQKKMASSIFRAFKSYKQLYDKHIDIPETVTSDIGEKHAGNYGIQIMSGKRLLKKNSREFKGWSCKYIKSGKTYKYYIGQYGTRDEAAEALKTIEKSFPGAFIITLPQ